MERWLAVTITTLNSWEKELKLIPQEGALAFQLPIVLPEYCKDVEELELSITTKGHGNGTAILKHSLTFKKS